MTIRSVDDTPSWLTDAVAQANIPTLACVLVHLTGDRGWIEGRFVPTRTRGLDDNDDGGLPEAVQAEIRARALTAIADWFRDGRVALADPPDALLVAMMGVSLGETIPSEYAGMIRHELQVDGGELPGSPAMPQAPGTAGASMRSSLAPAFPAYAPPFSSPRPASPTASSSGARRWAGWLWFEKSLPGCGLRCAEPPLLLLPARAVPMVALLRRQPRDPCLPGGCRRALRRSPPHPLRRGG